MRRYHYILTLRYIRAANDSSMAHTYEEGTYRPAPGQTRQDVFTHLVQRMREKEAEALAATGFGSIKPVVVFFSLEPDDLTLANA